MTFAEVPIGHLFQLRIWNCACLIRKTGEFTYAYTIACPLHADAETSTTKESRPW